MQALFAFMGTLTLQFFDTVVRLESDIEIVIDYFTTLFGRFLIPHTTPQFTYRLHNSNPNKFVYQTPSGTWQMTASNAVAQALAEKTIYSILAHVRSHYLFHAGVVTVGNKGAAIVGESQHGKTTLTLALLQAGASFLSDETLALAFVNGVVDYFPRQLNIRHNTKRLLNLELPSDEKERYAVSADTLFPSCIEKQTTLDSLFFLTNVTAQAPKPNQLHLWLNHMPPAFIHALHQLPSITTIEISGNRLTLTAPQPLAVFDEIERISANYEAIILQVKRSLPTKPDFSQPVTLQPLARADAVQRLLNNFQGGHHAAILHEKHAGNSVKMFHALFRRLSTVQCYQLSVGPLHDMKQFIISAMAD